LLKCCLMNAYHGRARRKDTLRCGKARIVLHLMWSRHISHQKICTAARSHAVRADVPIRCRLQRVTHCRRWLRLVVEPGVAALWPHLRLGCRRIRCGDDFSDGPICQHDALTWQEAPQGAEWR